MRIFCTALLSLFPLLIITPQLQASPILLDATVSGELTQQQECASPGCFVTGYSYQNPLVDMSYQSTLIPGLGTLAQGLAYLVFDLGSVAAGVSSAELLLDLQYAQSVNPELTAVSLDPAFAAPLSAIPDGSTDVSLFDMSPEGIAAFAAANALFQAISSGDPLGILNSSGPLNGPLSLTLNNNAVEQINAAGGLWVLGLRWTPSPVGPFNNQSDAVLFSSAPRLLLRTSAAVPLPGTLQLLVCALLFLRLPAVKSNSAGHNFRAERRGESGR